MPPGPEPAPAHCRQVPGALPTRLRTEDCSGQDHQPGVAWHSIHGRSFKGGALQNILSPKGRQDSRMLVGFNDLPWVDGTPGFGRFAEDGSSALKGCQLSDIAEYWPEAAASALPRRSMRRQSTPDPRRRESGKFLPASRRAVPPHRARRTPVQLVEHRGDLDAEPHRAQRRAVGHDHEDALARLSRVFAGRRREAHRIEPDARNAPRVERLGEPTPSIHGAPNCSNGVSVPRPTEMLVRLERADARVERRLQSGSACSATG